MRKFNRLSLSLLALAMLLLTACRNEAEEQAVTQSVTEDTQQETEEVNADENAEPEETKGSIIDNAENYDEQGILKYIPNTRIESGSQQEILFFQDKLLLWGIDLSTNSGPSLSMALLSMETGEVLQEVSYAEVEQPNVQICGDCIAVTDWSDGEVYILDASLQVIKQSLTGTEYTPVYLSSDAKKIYCFESEKGLTATDLESGNKESVIENTIDLYANSCCGETVTISYTDTTTLMTVNGVLDLATGTISQIPFTGAFYSAQSSGDIWLAGVYGSEIGEYYLGKSERPNSFVPYHPNAMVALLHEPARIMTRVFGANGLEYISLYETDGRFLSECTFEGKNVTIYNDPIWSEKNGGYFFLLEHGYHDALLFWDMSAPVSGMDLQFSAKYEGPAVGTEVSQDLYDRAAALGEQYGVSLKIAEQVAADYMEYMIAQELDETYISNALDVLEKVFSAYPDGFFEQLLFGNQYEIEIQLSGILTRKDVTEESTGFTSYGGFAVQDAGKNVIVLDIANLGSAERLLHHELAHLIDYKMAFDANIREEAVYSEDGWMALNPDGFAYAGSTIDLPMSFYTDGYDNWFIDLYSRTTILEDRARVMEYAMVGDTWGFGTPERLAKLEYWCLCIRDAFDTTGWPEMTVWESTLENCR